MSKYDITVFGAGIFGLSIAWECVRRGATVQVIDPYGVGAGASGGILGALAPHVPENWNEKKQFQLESLLMAEKWWQEIGDVGGVDPQYARHGRLQPVGDEAALLLAQKRVASAKRLWRGKASWEVVEASGSPWEPVTLSGKMVRDSLSAQVNPRAACAALAAACRRIGVTFARAGTSAGIEVWATGVQGLQSLGDELGEPVGQPIKGQAALLRGDFFGLPQIFADGIHIIAHPGGRIAVGSTTEREFDSLEPDAQIDGIIRRAGELVPAISGMPLSATWAGLRPRAKTRAPILGPHPTKVDVFIANGGFKIGFGMAPKIGAVMAGLIMEGRDEIPEGFRLSKLWSRKSC